MKVSGVPKGSSAEKSSVESDGVASTTSTSKVSLRTAPLEFFGGDFGLFAKTVVDEMTILLERDIIAVE